MFIRMIPSILLEHEGHYDSDLQWILLDQRRPEDRPTYVAWQHITINSIKLC